MIGRVLRLVFDSVAGQVIVLLVLSIAAIHGGLTAYFFLSNPRSVFSASPAETAGEIGAAAHMLAAANPAERPRLIELMADNLPSIALCADPVPKEATEIRFGPLAARLGGAAKAWKVLEGRPAPGDELIGPLFIELSDGACYRLDLPEADAPHFFGPGTTLLVFLLITTIVLVSWAMIVIIGPLRRFETAVERLRDMRSDVSVPEIGPRELRSAISAFNRMRARIGKLMAEKTTMLAAVSHDLRTPITRLRLRAEFIDDETIREPMLADLDHMAALAHVALVHLSGTDSPEPFDQTDLPSLLQTIADQFADLGHTVSYEGPSRLSACVRRRDIMRAVTNLADNAVRYGDKVVISLRKLSGRGLAISVADNGPGIPAGEREHLLEPFVRGDSARSSMPNSGFGLGLTIARDVAEAHGGRILLADHAPHGLLAVLEIEG
ncbi:ATP-binding protein [Pleomorphomonas sp. JP5]|uniref:ATP-binding protein n=1 Tax=Pleomorphomonas sp. JP5 TaxID=2942998 RepID=UPI002044A19A|nr:ATP-binding protein [Pleomorphomonas sp. JP5]MCM5559140.1 ATP-binding protein [Pleomorphomonas sp. JP5]